MNIVFLCLKAFSVVGGLEKFNKAFIKALYEISQEKKYNFLSLSPYDTDSDERYVRQKSFQGYSGSKTRFIIECIDLARRTDKLFVGHINLAPVALLMKLLNPGLHITLIAHGIEVWERQTHIKKTFLSKCDRVLAVSAYTKKKMCENNGIDPGKVIVFHNAIDPFFSIPEQTGKPAYLMERYGIHEDEKVLLTITRMNSLEGFKGYDKVIEALPLITKHFQRCRYLLCGKYDETEKLRIERIAEKHNVRERLMMPGFIRDDELTDHYLCGDVFVMPSKIEGFGIVFIEAAACGLPVVAGNLDGSRDALLDGKLGSLVDPDNVEEIAEVVVRSLIQPVDFNISKNIVNMYFSFNSYKDKLAAVLED